MSKVKEAVKTILEADLMVTDGWVTLYLANGPMGYREGDPTPYVVRMDDEPTEVYEEHENVDDAIASFLVHAGVNEA